jgi:hypothetical protein
MTEMQSAREVAMEFMLRQGRHFCENSYCDCVDKLAEVIQWQRSLAATAERERARAPAKPPKTKPTVAKARRPLPTAVDLRHADIRKAL